MKLTVQIESKHFFDADPKNGIHFWIFSKSSLLPVAGQLLKISKNQCHFRNQRQNNFKINLYQHKSEKKVHYPPPLPFT